jgi:hypothetical protein
MMEKMPKGKLIGTMQAPLAWIFSHTVRFAGIVRITIHDSEGFILVEKGKPLAYYFRHSQRVLRGHVAHEYFNSQPVIDFSLYKYTPDELAAALDIAGTEAETIVTRAYTKAAEPVPTPEPVPQVLPQRKDLVPETRPRNSVAETVPDKGIVQERPKKIPVPTAPEFIKTIQPIPPVPKSEPPAKPGAPSIPEPKEEVTKGYEFIKTIQPIPPVPKSEPPAKPGAPSIPEPKEEVTKGYEFIKTIQPIPPVPKSEPPAKPGAPSIPEPKEEVTKGYEFIKTIQPAAPVPEPGFPEQPKAYSIPESQKKTPQRPDLQSPAGEIDLKVIAQILLGQIKKIPGVIAVTIFHKDTKLLSIGDVNLEPLVTTADDMLAMVKGLNSVMEWGIFVHMTLQFSTGNVIIAPFFDEYVCIVTTPEINLGRIRRILRDITIKRA